MSSTSILSKVFAVDSMMEYIWHKLYEKDFAAALDKLEILLPLIYPPSEYSVGVIEILFFFAVNVSVDSDLFLRYCLSFSGFNSHFIGKLFSPLVPFFIKMKEIDRGINVYVKISECKRNSHKAEIYFSGGVLYYYKALFLFPEGEADYSQRDNYFLPVDLEGNRPLLGSTDRKTGGIESEVFNTLNNAKMNFERALEEPDDMAFDDLCRRFIRSVEKDFTDEKI